MQFLDMAGACPGHRDMDQTKGRRPDRNGCVRCGSPLSADPPEELSDFAFIPA